MKAALRLLYPPQCVSCGASVSTSADDVAQLCPDCWREASFITASGCARCGTPLPDDGREPPDENTLICDDCLRIARPWAHGRAAMVYAGTGRDLVLALKHGDRPDLAPALARWLAEAAAPLIRPGMVVAPVPLHLRRLFRRRYNQSALLAAHVARGHRLPHLPDLLRRLRHTPVQDHRDVAGRFDNIAGAIGVSPRRRGAIAGRAVLLIDDVMTSGATLTACTDALLEAGSGPISVAVLARAVKAA